MDADVDLLVLQHLGAWASLKSGKPYARVGKAKMERADEKRAHILLGEHREMELSDFMTTAEVVPLKKPA